MNGRRIDKLVEAVGEDKDGEADVDESVEWRPC